MADVAKQIRDILGNRVNGDIHGAAEEILAALGIAVPEVPAEAPAGPEPEVHPEEAHPEEVPAETHDA